MATKSHKDVLFGCIIAFALWSLMFSPWTAPLIPFWTTMACSASILVLYATLTGKKWWQQIHFSMDNAVLGILIAIMLWGVFWVGDKVGQWMFPSFARMQVDSIYGMKEGISPIILSLLLLLVIGPAEEIFWRGFVQKELCERIGRKNNGINIKTSFAAFVCATLVYALIHVFSLNLMLILAALVCGCVWGGLYWLMPNRLSAIVLSHAIWDAAVFVWFPI